MTQDCLLARAGRNGCIREGWPRQMGSACDGGGSGGGDCSGRGSSPVAARVQGLCLARSHGLPIIWYHADYAGNHAAAAETFSHHSPIAVATLTPSPRPPRLGCSLEASSPRDPFPALPPRRRLPSTHRATGSSAPRPSFHTFVPRHSRPAHASPRPSPSSQQLLRLPRHSCAATLLNPQPSA